MTNKLKEYQLDPITGAYVGDEPGADEYMPTVGADAEVAYDVTSGELPPIAVPPIEPVIPEPVIAPAEPVVWAGLRDIVIVNETAGEIAFDISLMVEVRDVNTQASVESGVVTRRVRICKQSLAKELCNRGSTAPITEALSETIAAVKTQRIDEASILAEQKRQAAIKRARELAGLPGKGNWV